LRELNPVIDAECTSVDIGISANLELVDRFYYLGDMLSVDRDADAAVETRICVCVCVLFFVSVCLSVCVRVADKKAAIGYTYEDSTAGSVGSRLDNLDDDDVSSDEDIDLGQATIGCCFNLSSH